MPPRRNRNRAQGAAAAAGAQAQAAAAAPVEPAPGEQVPAVNQQAPPAIAPPPFPLQVPGRTANDLQAKLLDLEYERAPRVARRKFANLGLNMWNLCAAKNMGYAEHGGLDDPLKRIILSFVGDAPLEGQTNPGFAARRMKEMTAATHRQMAAKIIDNILPLCEKATKLGNVGVNIKFEDAVKNSCGIPSQKPDANYWESLLKIVPAVKEAIERAGFTATAVPAKPDAEKEEDKQWKEKGVLRVEWG
ncbi:unnamed protein product [Amoebophrya sp. A120]|nr:unnamed protein product [Amoebophrya sp. A120]|eukprot:GSA120T00023378001.1